MERRAWRRCGLYLPSLPFCSDTLPWSAALRSPQTYVFLRVMLDEPL